MNEVACASASGVSETVALQAAEWFFLLQSDEATPDDRQRWAQWRAQHPEHASAWQRAERVGQKFALLPAALATPVLTRPPARQRRVAVRALAMLLVAAPAGWLAWRDGPAREWLAAHRTATGERRALTLADGSRIQLDTASAVDVRFDAALRLVRLHTGAIHVQTAPDPQGTPRPFVVATAQGRLRALGTRFVVRQEGAHSRIAVLQGAVEVRPEAAGGRLAVLQAGEQMLFTAHALGEVQPASRHVDDWTRGVLLARDMRLADFAAELGRYRPGVLRCDPAVADLRISGVFQLRDTGPVLDSLPQALPVAVLYRTRYWVTLAPPGR